MVSVETVSYGGWPNCQRVSNGQVEVIATTDVGPRLIRFGWVGGPNEFVEFPEHLGRVGGDEWRIYGGHRFWHAPEAMPRTYAPDNLPVAVSARPDGLGLTQPVEPETGIQKHLEVALAPEAAHVVVTHRLTNRGPWAVELAPWGLSAMAPGGTAILPLPPRGPHPEFLEPSSVLVLWPYTDLADPRWGWGSRYVRLRQDPGATTPQKVGALVPDGWAAYANGGRLFVKTFTPVPGGNYPDLGCSVETFTNAAMLELETLGPLVRVPPGGSTEHVEHWHLFTDVPVPASDADVDASLLPRVQQAVGHGA